MSAHRANSALFRCKTTLEKTGGTTPENSPWSGSSYGEHVAWSAPALDVFAAFTKKHKAELTFSVTNAAGTSDATALTTGIAALWLSYHGRDFLIQKYGKKALSDVFRKLVSTSGVFTPPNWPRSRFGAGIVDAQKVLEAPLP